MVFGLQDIDWKAQIFPKRDNLPRDLTSIDYLKVIAVTLMIVDHLGYYLFPDILWFRVIGRLCVPIWFFLIGFADTRDVPNRWLVAGVLLLITSLIVGLPPVPLTVLFTMAAIRLTIDVAWRFMLDKVYYFWWFVLLLVFFGYVTDKVMEYGTLGFLLASIGFVVRHREAVAEKLGQAAIQPFMVAVLGAFGAIEFLSFGFSGLQGMVLAAGLIGLFFVLQDFRVKTLPGTADGAQAPLIRFMGRYTLEIYVIHILVLKAVFGLKMLAVTVIG